MPEELQAQTPIPTPAPKPEKQTDYRRLSQKLERTLQEVTIQLETTQKELHEQIDATLRIKARCEQQQQYYNTALLAIVDNLKVMMRTIAILAGKVD